MRDETDAVVLVVAANNLLLFIVCLFAVFCPAHFGWVNFDRFHDYLSLSSDGMNWIAIRFESRFKLIRNLIWIFKTWLPARRFDSKLNSRGLITKLNPKSPSLTMSPIINLCVAIPTLQRFVNFTDGHPNGTTSEINCQITLEKENPRWRTL